MATDKYSKVEKAKDLVAIPMQKNKMPARYGKILYEENIGKTKIMC